MRRLALLLACIAPGEAAAQLRSQPLPGNPHVHVADFVADQVVTLEGAPGYQLIVELAPDEHVETVSLGDSGAWQVSASKRGDRLFVKPVQPGVTTNMVVVTDTRTYLLELAGLSQPQADTAYTVRFRYPAEGSAAPDPTQAAAAVVGRYKLGGNRKLRPAALHDDGVHTYIEWPASIALPATYAIDDQGRETLVNGMMREGLMVVDSIHDKLVFRIDDKRAVAKRVAEAVQ